MTGNDSGVYQCSTTNILGNSQEVMQLAVNGEFLVILNADIKLSNEISLVQSHKAVFANQVGSTKHLLFSIWSFSIHSI